MKLLTVGLLASGTYSDKYVYELALWASAQPNIRIMHLIVCACRPSSKRERTSPDAPGEASCNRVSRNSIVDYMITIDERRVTKTYIHNKLNQTSSCVSATLAFGFRQRPTWISSWQTSIKYAPSSALTRSKGRI